MKKKPSKAPIRAIVRLPRQFRWTLKSQNHPGIETWVKYVNVDMSERRLEIKVMEDEYLKVFDWIASFPHRRKSRLKDEIPSTCVETLLLTCYDGCGKVINALKFEKLRMVEHKCPFDYASNDVVTHELKVEFDKIEKIFEGEPKSDVNYVTFV